MDRGSWARVPLNARCCGRVEQVDPADRDLLAMALVLQVRGQHFLDHLLREPLGRDARRAAQRPRQEPEEGRGIHGGERDVMVGGRPPERRSNIHGWVIDG